VIRTSLRRRTYAVVIAVVLAPLVVVAIAERLGVTEMKRMQAAVDGAATETSAELARSAPEAWGAAVERAAMQLDARVLVIDAAGRAVAAADHEAPESIRDRAGDAMFGPEGPPTLRAFDQERAPGFAWPEIDRARRDGRSSGCAVALSGGLLVCHTALRAVAPRQDLVVLAQKSSPRAIRALFDLRYPLLKLTLYVLFLGALLALWLGRRIVLPIEQLRREVLRRAPDPLHAPPIPLSSNDEVADLGRAFNALLGALSLRSRANETFAADLAHELKSPIAALRACTDALENPVDPARAARLARVLKESTDRLDALVSQFLELARAEAGLPHDERARLDLAALVRGIMDSLAAEERFAHVRFDIDAAPTNLLGAAGPLESALRNILENAASFAGEAGWVRAHLRCEPTATIVEITDSGPGIGPENLPHVFDRFFTDRREKKGTGLGLAYAKAVIEAHAGTLAAVSEPGHGATFIVRLPAVSHTFHTAAANDSPAA